jgi:hypothetical protein
MLFALLPALFVLAGCATKDGWKGAEAEQAYDKQLEQIRLTAIINNDDYYEVHRDGRIYVLSDAREYREFLISGEIPLRVTEIGAGPNGETVVFAIAKPESKKNNGFGSVEMFKNRRQGAAKSFYAEIHRNDRYYVFGDWVSFDAYRKTGQAGGAPSNSGPNGEPVVFTPSSNELVARFKSLRGMN